MAAGHGKDAVFKIQDAAGVTRDISAYVTNSTMDESADVADVSGLGSTSKSYVIGLKDGTFSIEGIFDPTVDGYLAGDLGFSPARTFEYHPQGVVTGKPKYSGSAFVVAYAPSTPIGDAGKWTARLQASGDIVRALNP